MRFPGGQRGLARLVEEHYQALYRYAYRLSGAQAEAEDLTQETFCQAQQKFYQLRDAAKAKSWLFAILRNIYLHRLRDTRRMRNLSLEWVEDVPLDDADPLPEVDPQQLQSALNELPEVYRSAIILYYFEDFSYRDIADHMEVPIGTVMSRLARAKSHLRTRLFPPASSATTDSERRARDGM